MSAAKRTVPVRRAETRRRPDLTSRRRAPDASSAVDARHPALIAAALVAAACILTSVSFTLYDADVWQNLIFGRAIWTLHAVPTTQPFAWPTFGAPLVNPSWGFTAVVWPFWSLGGVTGLFVWRWLSTLVVFGVAWTTARRLGARGFSALVVLAIAALVYRQRSQIRPETLASVWLALTILLLERWRRAGEEPSGGRAAIAPLVWVVVVLVAWANTHISFYLGLLLIGIHLVDARLDGRVSTGAAAGIALAAVAATLVNPYGIRTLARPFQYAFVWRNEPIFRSISEIRPPDWSINWANGLPLLMAGWPLLILWRRRHAAFDRVEAAMAVVFSALALTSTRFVAAYAVAAAPYLARDLGAWLSRLRLPLALRRVWLRAALASLACVGAGLYEWSHYQGPIRVEFDRRHTPDQACRFMAAHGVRGRGFNHFYIAGTMLWHFWPERDRLPFMTGSPEDFPREQRDGYDAAVRSPEGWRALDARYRFDYALMSRRYTESYSLLDLLDQDPAWARVFVDDLAAVYVRRDGPLAPVARAYGYRVLPGGRAGLGALVQKAAADPALRASLEAELDRQAREAQSNFYGRELRRALARAAP